ncbi:hypothetical protein K443DRAFT_681364 [Laccaria amethystina LaAM-08-1]|uniref:Uncharacterized protein n=1 Tax=Laccaria amethystina LaAM-08-1 TaxID=1095629 RepID=A0A0C9WLY7_9AGAR|nr:hypothetical protein K443DRAFT_681364 [Laccaria amethystina LaAM-08-1]
MLQNTGDGFTSQSIGDGCHQQHRGFCNSNKCCLPDLGSFPVAGRTLSKLLVIVQSFSPKSLSLLVGRWNPWQSSWTFKRS